MPRISKRRQHRNRSHYKVCDKELEGRQDVTGDKEVEEEEKGKKEVGPFKRHVVPFSGVVSLALVIYIIDIRGIQKHAQKHRLLWTLVYVT